MISKEKINILNKISKSPNLTAEQQKEIESILIDIRASKDFTLSKQILYLIMKILIGSDDFPDF